MAKMQSKKGLIVTIAVLVIAFLVVGGIALAKNHSGTSSTVTTNTSAPTPAAKDTSTETDVTEENTPATKATTPAVDPSTLASIDIQPLGITVFYTKGTPGFDFAIVKTADNTQYVQFTSPDLVGTKCTNDEGAFVSIIKNPSANEIQITTQTTKVGDDTYGLSLAGPDCTSNTKLLTQYQNSFTAGFSSLKAL